MKRVWSPAAPGSSDRTCASGCWRGETRFRASTTSSPSAGRTSPTSAETPCSSSCAHDITWPLYVEVDRIYNLACPASPVHYQFDPVQTTKTSVHGAINMLGLAKRLKVRILQVLRPPRCTATRPSIRRRSRTGGTCLLRGRPRHRDDRDDALIISGRARHAITPPSRGRSRLGPWRPGWPFR